MKRESFGSRLGFILVSAGCAIGIGNVWKFPYICVEATQVLRNVLTNWHLQETAGSH